MVKESIMTRYFEMVQIRQIKQLVQSWKDAVSD